jgi:hypothetical protein
MFTQLKARLRLIPAAVLLLLAGTASAQFNASLSGTVLDSTQAAIPGATITLTNPATQITKTVTSGPEGTYTFSELPPGNYSVTAAAKGFQQNAIANVAVAAETPRQLNITLQLGQENQTVTVDADNESSLQTGDASIGSTISSEEIERLPIFGADPYELLRTAPGISGDGARSGNGNAVFLPNGAGPGGSNSGIFQTENQVQISGDGQRVGDNNFMIDGVSVNSLSHDGSAVVTPNQEAVGSISVVSTSYDASLGRNTGAQIQVVTKSGTNKIHGSAFFLYDEPGLNSFNKYGGPAPLTPTIRDDNKQRTWAASLGGPIFKDKLFFFASYEEYKDSNPSFSNGYVETPQFRAAVIANRGNGVTARTLTGASAAPRLVSVIPLTTATGCTNVPSPCQVVNGMLDLGSLSAGGTTQLGVFVNPGPLDSVPDVEYGQIETPEQSRGNQYNARIDWQATQKDLVAGSVYFTKLDNLGSSGAAGARPQSDVPFKPLNSAGTLIYIHTFSPSWLNELRGNVTRFADNEVADGGGTVNYGIPFDNVQGYPFALQYGVNGNSVSTPATFAENTYEVRDTVTHTWGSHTLHVGYEARFEQDNDDLSGYERPTYAFTSLWNFANDASVYEAIYANPNTGLHANTQRYYRSQDYAAFVQHDWKVTPNFTLNAGLRWEEFTPPANKGSQVNYPMLGPAGKELSGMTLIPHNHLWNFQHNNFGPKVGFAYTPAMLHNRIVIRGGYALAYNHLDAALYNVSVEDGPGIASFGLCCGGNGNTAGIIYSFGTSNSPDSYPFNPALKTGTQANGFPVGGVQEVYGAASSIKYPSSDLYSFEIQGQLNPSTTATIGYQGASGRHFARLVDQNFLYQNAGAQAGQTYFLTTDSVANYNSFNVQLRRPMRHNIGYSVVYTYAKSLDQVSNGDGPDGNANQTNPANNASEYGPSDYDVKHRVVATGLYQTPNLHTGSHIVNTLASGFQINGTYTWHTGFPWTPVTGALQTTPVAGIQAQNIVRPTAYYGGAGSSCSNSAFTTGSNFPNRTVTTGTTTTNVGGSNYFKQTLPQTGVYTPGIGRNSFRGPCYQDVDVSLAKEFAATIHDHDLKLRVQANMYNFFNQEQLQPITFNSNPGSDIPDPYFGYSATADAGRVIELQARIQF